MIDQKYEGDDDLYICFPVDGTCNWYLIKHSELYRLVEQNAPNAFNTKRWQNQGNYFSHGTNKSMRKALEHLPIGQATLTSGIGNVPRM